MAYNYNEIVELSREYEKQIKNKNIGAIAILDTGVYAHSDLNGRILDFVDLVADKNTLYDDNGHGTHLCGIIAGSGLKSGGKIRGISEKCPIVAVKVLSKQGNGKVANVLKGFEYVLKNRERLNIRIVNISMGAEIVCGDDETRELEAGVNYLWERGLVVLAAGGNNGPDKMSITAPGNAKKIITIGACDDDLKAIVKSKNYSGRGPTCECVIKPDVVTVGTNIVSLKNSKNGYISRSGTSMATAVASGVIGVFMENHQDYTPKEIKKLLLNTAVDMGKDIEIQGNGELNIKALYNL